MSMKIIISNTVTLNGGDAAILNALIYVLRENFGSKTEFVVYDNQPRIANRYYPELNFRKLIYLSINDLSNHFSSKFIKHFKPIRELWSWVNCLRFYFAVWCWCNRLRILARILLKKHELEDLISYESADIIISTGGTYLVENYDFSSRIFDYKISILMNKPLVFFTQSLGPFSNRCNRRDLSKIFRDSLLIFLRDEKSREHLMDLGVDMRKVYVFPDIAFASPINEISKEDTAIKFYKKQPLNVGISVRYWPFFKQVDKTIGMKNYMEVISKTVTNLKTKYNASVTFVSTCQGIPDYWADDSKVALEIWSGLPDNIKKDVIVNHSFHTTLELLGILASFDMVIATRMHMAILSLIAGTPVISIAYEFKTKELFKQLGLAEWTQDIETLETESFQKVVDSFLRQFPENSEDVFNRVAEERERAIDSGQLVKVAYDNWMKLQKS